MSHHHPEQLSIAGTGHNGPLGLFLMLEGMKRRGKVDRQDSAEAGYCLDAPALMPAGSVAFCQFGPEPGDWVAEQTSIER